VTYEIRTEALDAPLGLDLKTGKASTLEKATRVRYRPEGKRGRFETFVLCGDFKPRDLPKIVARHAEMRAAERGAR
jgi:hypothetical protein